MSDSSKPVNCRIFLAGALRAARWLLAARQASHLDSAVVFQIIFCLELFISRILFCSRSHFRLSPHSPCLYFIKPIALSSGFCLGKQKRERSWEISLALACCPKVQDLGEGQFPRSSREESLQELSFIPPGCPRFLYTLYFTSFYSFCI